jgi:hypothetical protein
MSGHPDKIAEHYRELAAEEVALAKAAVTNGARAKHYALAAEYWLSIPQGPPSESPVIKRTIKIRGYVTRTYLKIV